MGGVTNKYIELQFLCLVMIYEGLYYCHDHLWGSLSEFRHLRGNIRLPWIIKLEFHCNLGIEQGCKEQVLKFSLFGAC